MKKIMEIADEILEVHGVAPGGKAEGVTRVIYENSDRTKSWKCSRMHVFHVCLS